LFLLFCNGGYSLYAREPVATGFGFEIVLCVRLQNIFPVTDTLVRSQIPYD